MKNVFVILSLLFSISSFSQIEYWSDNFESYQGFGDLPENYTGGMRVYFGHGFISDNGLCINFSQFKSVDSTITPPSAVLGNDAVFKFRYRYANYIAGTASSAYEMNSDILEVYAAIAGSNDFGSPLLTIDNNTHIPTLEFAPVEVDLSIFSGESVQIKLKGVRGDVADFWLDTDDYIIEGQEPTSVSQINFESFNFGPNPANDFIRVSSLGYETIEICSLQGERLISQVLNDKVSIVNTSDLPAGIYILSISNSVYRKQKKIVVTH